MADITFFNTSKTEVGWNQLVTIDDSNNILGLGDPSNVFRVATYNIGVTQKGEAPDFVGGRQDRTAWRKGSIESQGSLEFPFTLPNGGTQGIGLAIFRGAADLAANPNKTFAITSSAHPQLSGAKINTCTIECQAGEKITSRAEIWGITALDDLITINSYGDTARIDYTTDDTSDGVTIAGNPSLRNEQIPQWDIVKVVGAPAGMAVKGFSLTIDNRLKRNYTMGDGGNTYDYSPFGLNATNITCGQRMITGTITWQSSFAGRISQVIAVGISSLVITIGPAGGDQLIISMPKAMWNAEPPTLNPTDVVTMQSSFTALGTNDAEFDAMTLSGALYGA